MSIAIKLSYNGSDVELLGAGLPIGISSSGVTERKKGLSTLRFMLEGEALLKSDPFDVLTEWKDDEVIFVSPVG